MAEINIEGGVKLLYLRVGGLVGMLKSQKIPVQGLLGGGLAAGEVMGGDAGIVMGLGTVPGLLIEAAGFGGAIFKFGLGALKAKGDDGVGEIHSGGPLRSGQLLISPVRPEIYLRATGNAPDKSGFIFKAGLNAE